MEYQDLLCLHRTRSKSLLQWVMLKNAENTGTANYECDTDN